LTALFASRFVPVPCVPADYSTIIGGSHPAVPQGLITYSNRYISARRWKVKSKPFTTYLSTSMGPSGPAMLTSFSDLTSLSERQKSAILMITEKSNSRDMYFREVKK